MSRCSLSAITCFDIQHSILSGAAASFASTPGVFLHLINISRPIQSQQLAPKGQKHVLFLSFL